MEHERGAFKVQSRDMLGAVKKYPEIRWFRRFGGLLPPLQCPQFVP
jgi:hypothetical protein